LFTNHSQTPLCLPPSLALFSPFLFISVRRWKPPPRLVAPSFFFPRPLQQIRCASQKVFFVGCGGFAVGGCFWVVLVVCVFGVFLLVGGFCFLVFFFLFGLGGGVWVVVVLYPPPHPPPPPHHHVSLIFITDPPTALRSGLRPALLETIPPLPPFFYDSESLGISPPLGKPLTSGPWAWAIEVVRFPFSTQFCLPNLTVAC